MPVLNPTGESPGLAGSGFFLSFSSGMIRQTTFFLSKKIPVPAPVILLNGPLFSRNVWQTLIFYRGKIRIKSNYL